MKRIILSRTVLIVLLCVSANTISFSAFCQDQPPAAESLKTDEKTAEAAAKSDADLQKKAAQWVASLSLGDADKATRVEKVITEHLKATRDWHNSHPSTMVPAGINPTTGKPLSVLDRQIIADSTIPKTVHENLMAGLRKDLSAEQVEAILDKYTVGKVAFTMNGYHTIVPDLTAAEEAAILGFLKQAREEAVDYKDMKEISAIFKIHKTESEQYLNSNGRNWKVLYKAAASKAKKGTAAQEPKADE